MSTPPHSPSPPVPGNMLPFRMFFATALVEHVCCVRFWLYFTLFFFSSVFAFSLPLLVPHLYLFRFVLFCFVSFCFVLFCFVLFCFVLFCLFLQFKTMFSWSQKWRSTSPPRRPGIAFAVSLVVIYALV